MKYKRIAVSLITGAVLSGGALITAPQATAATATAAVQGHATGVAATAPAARLPTVAPAAAPAAVRTAAAAPKLDRRCRTGRVLCVDKGDRKVYWVVNGRVQMVLDARFGGKRTPTREGSFRVYRKSRNHVSSLYHTRMPFALFFKGGQAVHYSPDFARKGYRGTSHGCVNTRQWSKMKALYGKVRVGDRVVVSK